MVASKRKRHGRCCARKIKQPEAAARGGAFEAYLCRWCGHWHVGHAKPQVERSPE